MTKETLTDKIKISQEIFRAYDIRGIYGQTLTSEIIVKIGQALGTKTKELGIHEIIVARDGRLSGPVLLEALIEGITATGCDVINIGAVPTPLLYYATKTLTTNTGIMLTGSHNPANYNGLKMVLNGKTLMTTDITDLYDRIQANQFIAGKGNVKNHGIIDAYIQEICSQIKLKKPLKVVVDAGNGIAGNVAPKLLRVLGCEVVELFCEVDGHFPNHHPDPGVLKNLEALIKTVKRQKADIGLAFDGDGDRLGVITNQGENIWPDRQLMLYAKDVIQKNLGATIIFDVKCTRYLPQKIREYGGNPVMWKTGHSMMKAKILELGALLAGEMSGHIFFNDRWYGFDDAIYTAARLLEIISSEDVDVSKIFANFPDSVNTPELKLPISEERKFEFMEQFIKNAQFANATISTIDGIRVDFPYGWGLIRPSNTTPYLIMRFEADDVASLEAIQKGFREQLRALDENLLIPF